MKENKMVMMVAIVTIVSILLVFGGITYAYFTAFNNQGSTAEITVGPGKMIITYNDGTDNIVPLTDIQPSDKILVNKTFSLTGTNTATGVTSSDGLNMPYKVGLKYTSTFSDGQIHYYIKEVNRPNSSNVTVEYTGTTNQTVQGNTTYIGYSHGTLKKGNDKYTEMVIGNFPSSTSNQTVTFNLILQFPDTGENQDSEKGAIINGKIVINYEVENMSKTITNLYNSSTKDSNGITLDGLQKDGTGAYNIKNLSTTLNKYNVSLLGNIDNNVIADIETDAYDNIRYVGANPNNYLSFNDETWRIIGVFNNITTIDEQGNEKTESLVKIIRNDSLGNYSWDTAESTVNSGIGVNEWSQADLMTELNTDYIDTTKTSGTITWYNGENNSKTAMYDYSKNIKSSVIDKIAKVRWNLGGYEKSSVSAFNMYYYERGKLHKSNPSDGIARTNTWDGKIALMYPSDYGYASTNLTCRNNFDNCDDADSKANNWLFNSSYQWTLTPTSHYEYYAFAITPNGFLWYDYVSGVEYYDIDVRPALYLKSDVVITGGTGAESDPFILG